MPKPFVNHNDIDQRIVNEIIWYPGDRVEIKGHKGRIVAVNPTTLMIEYDSPVPYTRMDDSVEYNTHIQCRKDRPTRITEDYE